MQFKIDLSRVQYFPELPLRYDEELDDVRSILSDICEALADGTPADFLASGFGQARWPVDVRTDLPAFLEQLPDAIASAESGISFSLDFYEQGIARTIHFAPQDQHYSAQCESHTEWKPNPVLETIDRLELQRMLSDVRENLMYFLARKSPLTAAHPWIKAWAGAALR